jgi:hypothetical protein
MIRPLLSLLTVCLVAAPALAQSIGEPIPGRSPPGKKPSPWQAEPAARPCPQYGPGFVRIDGSSLCVRAGGSVRVDVGKSSVGKSSRSGYGSSARGVVELETRGETSLGPVRSVVRAGGRIGHGLDDGYGPYRY